jgi:CubicO group peptidase (beta-lactamase class C family)
MIEKAYFPPPESRGGWRYLIYPENIRVKAGMDPAKLDSLHESQLRLYAHDAWSAVIIRHGYLVKEMHSFNVSAQTRFDIWSGTKSFTGTAWGLLLDDSKYGRLQQASIVTLDSPAYSFIPEGYPLTDPRKACITIRHLLTMTSGLPGESAGVRAMAMATDAGPFEHALGKSPNRFGKWTSTLAAEPGQKWDYSDAGICHLALAYYHITGREIADVLKERVLDPIGIENLSWDVQGGAGFIGPHTNGHTGIHVSARELARFGYLALNKGIWAGKPLIPPWWMDLATRSSQVFKPDYGYTWWVNNDGSGWPGLPRDMFALMGYRSNKCYIVPALDLVVARVGSGPETWPEGDFISEVARACLVAAPGSD